LPMTEDAFPSGHCLYNATAGIEVPRGYACSQMKFPWGLVYEYRSRQERGDAMPYWWYIKDDDTYIHADRLMALVDDYNPEVERVAMGMFDTTGMFAGDGHFYGGLGWLISAAAADVLVMERGNEWLRLQEDQIHDGVNIYDAHSSQFLGWIDGLTKLSFPPSKSWSGQQFCIPPCGDCVEGDGRIVSHHMQKDRTLFNDTFAVEHAEQCFS